MAAGSWWRRLFGPFLDKSERQRVSAAVAKAEQGTSGEIHVHLVDFCPGDPLELARRKFSELGLDRTRRRNGVIVLVATKDHRFAVWGDSGIHAKAGQELWEHAKAALENGLREGRPAEGLSACVAEVGAALKAHFPPEDDNPNELPDAVTES